MTTEPKHGWRRILVGVDLVGIGLACVYLLLAFGLTKLLKVIP